MYVKEDHMELLRKTGVRKGSSNCTADSLSRLPVCLGGSKAPFPGGRVQQLSELPTVQKMEVLDIGGEDISTQAIGQEVSFDNEYLYLLRKFNWLRDVKFK